jgi:hypothetical protein
LQLVEKCLPSVGSFVETHFMLMNALCISHFCWNERFCGDASKRAQFRPSVLFNETVVLGEFLRCGFGVIAHVTRGIECFCLMRLTELYSATLS